ncbi:hypothetical protein [Clostridium sp.]|uniref:hypothetical protein n=1 Tax=Clostridium sp. TaxID=1506 RepID=UPI00284A40DC|nr:hypothetical protein [Clostridium sp.]MDR3596939.1 hypothetical protein [Clostridium sp.]
MIKAIAIYPGFDPDINEMAYIIKSLCKEGKAEFLVFTRRHDILKNSSFNESFNNYKNLKIVPFEGKYPEFSFIESTIREFNYKPDLFFIATTLFLSLTRNIKKHRDERIILHTEYFLNKRAGINKRYYLGIPLLKNTGMYFYYRYIYKLYDLIMCSDQYFENDKISNYEGLVYLPWPIFPPENNGFTEKDKNFSCYIGSLSTFKGFESVCEFYSSLLSFNQTMKVKLIGPIIDKKSGRLLDEIRNKFPYQVEWEKKCTREEAIRDIRKSLFVLCPKDILNWGFIGDAWANKTLIITFGEQYGLKDSENCLLYKGPNEIARLIDKINDNPYYNRLTENGFLEYKSKHSTEYVKTKLLTYMNSVC